MQESKKMELLRKIKDLAERGVGGEKINAQRMLRELMEKCGLREGDLEECELDRREFYFASKREMAILGQVIYKVLDRTSGIYQRGKILGCFCTAAQEIEIEFLFDFYKRLYRREEEVFYNAFVQKHKIFGRLQEGEAPQEVSEEEYAKMCGMMRAMYNETPHRQIPQSCL